MEELNVVQKNWIQTGEKLIPVLRRIKKLEEKSKREIFLVNKEMILSYAKSVLQMVQLFGYEKYFEPARELYELSGRIERTNTETNNKEIDNTEINKIYMGSDKADCARVDEKAIDTVLDAVIVIADDMIKERKGKEKKCTCCENVVYYRPLSDYYKKMGKKYAAPEFKPEFLNENEYECPICMATDRDRMMIDFLKELKLDAIHYEESLLHIAPSSAIDHWIHRNCPSLVYHTADKFMEEVDYAMDIQNMKEIANDSYDIIICSHVLEHVEDDRMALLEKKCILKEDGFCVFLVPVDREATSIDEAWGLSEAENWKRFGQGDHCRRYCSDGLMERLTESGFYVHKIGKDFLGDDTFYQGAYTETSVLYVLTKKEGELRDLISSKLEKRKNITIEKPLVSVVMSAYNHENYVAETIESVLNQTYENVEFLVVDDASTDKTADVIRKYEDKIEDVTYLEENTYAYYLLELINKAKGEYIALINSDDIWMPEKLEKQIAYLTNHKECMACFTGVEMINDAGEKLNIDLFKKRNSSSYGWMHFFFENGNCLCHPSILLKKERYMNLIKEERIFRYRQLPDFYMWMQLIQKGKIHVIEEELIRYRFHVNEANTNVSAPNMENNIRTANEGMYIWYETLKNMEDSFFKCAFYENLLDKNVVTKKEVQCEKILLLLNSGDVYYRQASLLLFYDFYDEELLSILKNKYGISRHDIYKIASSYALSEINL